MNNLDKLARVVEANGPARWSAEDEDLQGDCVILNVASEMLAVIRAADILATVCEARSEMLDTCGGVIPVGFVQKTIAALTALDLAIGKALEGTP